GCGGRAPAGPTRPPRPGPRDARPPDAAARNAARARPPAPPVGSGDGGAGRRAPRRSGAASSRRARARSAPRRRSPRSRQGRATRRSTAGRSRRPRASGTARAGRSASNSARTRAAAPRPGPGPARSGEAGRPRCRRGPPPHGTPARLASGTGPPRGPDRNPSAGRSQCSLEPRRHHAGASWQTDFLGWVAATRPAAPFSRTTSASQNSGQQDRATRAAPTATPGRARSGHLPSRHGHRLPDPQRTLRRRPQIPLPGVERRGEPPRFRGLQQPARPRPQLCPRSHGPRSNRSGHRLLRGSCRARSNPRRGRRPTPRPPAPEPRRRCVRTRPEDPDDREPRRVPLAADRTGPAGRRDAAPDPDLRGPDALRRLLRRVAPPRAMSRRERARDAKPVPVTEAVRHLIRSTTGPAAAAAPERAGHGEEGQPTPSRIRSFAADGEAWIARIAGESTAGSDSFAAPALVAIRFARARTPEHDEREILIPRGRFQSLRDEEFA